MVSFFSFYCLRKNLDKTTVLRSNGGTADFQAAFKLDQVREMFKWALDNINAVTNAEGTDYIASFIDESELARDRENFERLAKKAIETGILNDVRDVRDVKRGGASGTSHTAFSFSNPRNKAQAEEEARRKAEQSSRDKQRSRDLAVNSSTDVSSKKRSRVPLASEYFDASGTAALAAHNKKTKKRAGAADFFSPCSDPSSAGTPSKKLSSSALILGGSDDEREAEEAMDKAEAKRLAKSYGYSLSDLDDDE